MFWFSLCFGLSHSSQEAVRQLLESEQCFSIFPIVKYSKRITKSFYLLVLSFFLLLIAYPPFLFQLGFQMSYLVVFGILWIHPLLQKLWKSKFWLLKRFWQLTTVSIAAQFAFAPLSIYTFH